MALRLIESEQRHAERILSAIAGDQSAQSWLVESYTAPIFRYCYRMLRNTEDAQELTQEVLLRALRNIERFDPNRSFKTWVFSIARNACIDFHRKKRPTVSDAVVPLEDKGPLPSEITLQKERAQRLEQALDTLAPLYREVIILYHFEHLKYQEIAETLDVPLGTVMNRIFRARKKLREAYGEQP